MSASETLSNIPLSQPRKRELMLWAILAIEVLLLVVPVKVLGIAAASVAALIVIAGISLSIIRGRVAGLLLGWVLIFPLGYYFCSFPEIKPILTLDRVFIALLLTAGALSFRKYATEIPAELRKSAICWCVFVLFAGITVPRAKNTLNSFRLLVEAFLFPAIVGGIVLCYVDIRKHLRALHTITCLMALYVAAIGMAEVVMQRDLLPLADGDIAMAGDYKASGFQLLVRPNGPFSTTNSFALVGITSFLFLLFLRQVLPEMRFMRRMLHRAAISAAFATALMPLFRSVVLSFTVMLLIDAFYCSGFRRALRFAAIGTVAAGFLLVWLLLPAVFEERSDPENVYGRVAQQVQTLRLFFDHPVTGVALNNYHDAVLASTRYTTAYDDVESVDYPHNNLGAVLSETGILGFVPYMLSQVFLLGFWKTRRRAYPSGELAWKYFLFLFLGYWINGLSLTSGYFADLNIWYVLVLMIIIKYVLSEPPLLGPVPVEA